MARVCFVDETLIPNLSINLLADASSSFKAPAGIISVIYDEAFRALAVEETSKSTGQSGQSRSHESPSLLGVACDSVGGKDDNLAIVSMAASDVECIIKPFKAEPISAGSILCSIVILARDVLETSNPGE